MSDSGYIDWHRLNNTQPWTVHHKGWKTYVHAFWLAHDGTTGLDEGVRIFKDDGKHPDWFVHADTAATLISAHVPDTVLHSPNFHRVFHDDLHAKPLLASILLGSADVFFRAEHGVWWAHRDDLTRRGRKLLQGLDRLYERPAVLVTFIEAPSDEDIGPRDPG